MKILAGIGGALLVYTSLVAYLGWAVYSWLASFWEGANPWVFAVLWLVVAYSYIIGRIGHKWLSFTILGSYWFAFLQYAILVIPVANVLVLAVEFMDDVFIIGSAAAIILLVIFIVGTYLAYSPVVRNLEITVDGKEAEDRKSVV